MRNKIGKIISKYLKNYFWNIKYGYDCICITIDYDTEIPLDLIISIKEELDTEGVLLGIVNGNLTITCDISNFILKCFDTWDEYEKEYDLDDWEDW